MVFTATAAVLLDGEAFNRLVAEEDLRTWEQAGYIYTKKRGKSGIELYRTYGPKWRKLLQFRRVLTQSNVGGGALDLRASVPSGYVVEVVAIYHQGPLTNNTNIVNILDEDAAETVRLAGVAAATATFYLPSIGAAASASAALMQSLKLLLGPGQSLRWSAGAAAQNETLTAGLIVLAPIEMTADQITWSTAASAGTPSLAASTISAANTEQAVLLP